MAIFNGQVRKVNKSLRYSVLDGSAFAAMFGLTQNYIVPFALALKATTAQIGLLTSIPSLMMAASQLAAPKLAEKAGSRKALILPVVFLHALMWLPILLVPYLMPGDKIWWLITFVTISTVFGAMANPAWGSMMADLVPERIRGRYFAGRGRIASFVTLVFSFAAGGLLQILQPNVFLGFALIFGAALVFRFVSLYFLARMYELPQAHSAGNHERLMDVARSLPSTNLGHFTIFVALISFSTNLAAPFFTVYMLRDLQFSYLTFVIITSVGALTALFFLRFWGKRADRGGNIRVIKVTSVLVPFIPLLWLVSHEPVYLAGVETFSSFAWAGFNLAAMNFVFDAAPAEGRTRRIAVFNALNGVAICIGALTGGFMASRLPSLLGSNLLSLFAISGVLRLAVVVLFVGRFTEVRHVHKSGLFDFMLARHAPGAASPAGPAGVLHGNGGAHAPPAVHGVPASCVPTIAGQHEGDTARQATP